MRVPPKKGMSMATAVSPHPATRSGFSVVRPGDLPHAKGHTSDVVRKYANDLFALPGALDIAYSKDDPSTIYIDFDAPEHVNVAGATLESEIDHIKVVPQVGSEGVRAAAAGPRQAHSYISSDVLHAVGAMKGVWNVREFSDDFYHDGFVQFQTIDQSTIDRLDPIIKDKLLVGKTPNDEDRYFHFEWVPGVPAAKVTHQK
jgi:hypothetical protein